MASADQVARDYIAAVQAARREGSESRWAEVERLLAPDFEIRLAGFDGREEWTAVRDKESWLERLKSLPWSELATETVSAFGDDQRAAVEQVSTWHEGDRQLRKRVCFLFEVAAERVRRISVYRNDREPP